MNPVTLEDVYRKLTEVHRALERLGAGARAVEAMPTRPWYNSPVIDTIRTWVSANPFTAPVRPAQANQIIRANIGYPAEIPTAYLKQALLELGYRRTRDSDGTWYYPPS